MIRKGTLSQALLLLCYLLAFFVAGISQAWTQESQPLPTLETSLNLLDNLITQSLQETETLNAESENQKLLLAQALTLLQAQSVKLAQLATALSDSASYLKQCEQALANSVKLLDKERAAYKLELMAWRIVSGLCAGGLLASLIFH